MGLLLDLAGIALVVPVLVFVHELGHAVTAVAAGVRPAELRVGNSDPVLAIRTGGFAMRLGAIGDGDVAGYVAFDRGVRPWQALLIALGGPFASLGSACAALLVLAVFSPWPFTLITTFVIGLLMFVGNLVPYTTASGLMSDGRIVLLALRALHAPAPPADPREATSVAPPGY